MHQVQNGDCFWNVQEGKAREWILLDLNPIFQLKRYETLGSEREGGGEAEGERRKKEGREEGREGRGETSGAVTIWLLLPVTALYFWKLEVSPNSTQHVPLPSSLKYS